MAWSATATAMAAAVATRTPWRLAQLERADQVVKTLTEQLVDLRHNAGQLGAIKMSLHHVHHIMDQQVTLGLHDRARVRTDKEHHKIISRFSAAGFIFIVKLRYSANVRTRITLICVVIWRLPVVALARCASCHDVCYYSYKSEEVTLQFEGMLSHIALKGSVNPGDGSGSAVDAQLDTNTDSWALLSGSLEGGSA